MLAYRVVEHLDVMEHILPGFVALAIDPLPDTFALEQVEKALDHRVVIAVAKSARHDTPHLPVRRDFAVPFEAAVFHGGVTGGLYDGLPLFFLYISVSVTISGTIWGF